MESKTYPLSKKRIFVLFSIFLPIFIVVIIRALTLPPLGWQIWIWIVGFLAVIYTMLCLGLFVFMVWKPIVFGGVEPTLSCSARSKYNGYDGFTMKVKYIQAAELDSSSKGGFFKSTHLIFKCNDPIDPKMSKRGILDMAYYDDSVIVQLVSDLKVINPSIETGPRLNDFLAPKK